MQGDQLLQQWKRSKQICQKIIQISKNANLYNKINESPMQKQTSRQFMSVYDTVYKLCLTKEKEETRVTMVYKDFKDILKNALLSMCQDLKNERDIYKLKYLRRIWEAYCDILKRMMHMFAYLNRPYHIKQGRIEQLQKTGMGIIVLTLFNQNSTEQYECIYLRQVQRIRKIGDFSNAVILRQMVEMLYKIHIKLVKAISKKAVTRYTEFQSKFLKHAKEHYQKMHHQLKELNPAQYFQQVDNLYSMQTKVALECFGVGGSAIIDKQFAQEFIQKYRETLLKSPKGLKSILHNGQIHTLKIIVQIYMKLTKNIEGFKEQFQEYIFEDVRDYMQEIKPQLLIRRNTTVYCAFMQRVVNKNKEYLKMLQESFMHLGDFLSYYKAGFEKALSSVKLPISIEQILAIYVDSRLKFNSIEQLQVESSIRNIMSIFMCIENKDMFLMKYTQKLAKKLLSTNQQTVKNHESFIQSLKLNCGIKFTERLETLIYEYSIHEEYERTIKKIMDQKNIQLDFKVRIFSEGSWPTTNIIDVPLHYFPESITKVYECFNIYRDEYCNKKTFKISFLQSKFRWIYHFQKQVQNKLLECYFQTNCLQGAILNLIYRKRPQKVDLKLIEHYYEKVTMKVIKQNINRMVDINENILIRHTQGNQLFYEFNSRMKSTKRLINYESGINNEEERLFQQQDLGKDRQIVLDANIAKLMKSRKITDFQTVFAQITKMIRTFNPQKKDIKIAIQRLISKQLLQRDEKDVTKIKYID